VERFLRKQVGRRWDEVYSEVCAVAPKGTKAGQRLREVVLNAVETSVFMDGEDIRCKWGYVVGDLFVHPQTGILSLPESKRKRWKKSQRFTPKREATRRPRRTTKSAMRCGPSSDTPTDKRTH
jgi:hypothetical protein